MRRLFNPRQRLILWARSGGKCHRCGDPLSQGFHADHNVPFSRGGETILINGQALCPSCNLLKGNKIMKLRDWQQAARAKAIKYFTDTAGDRHFVINAAPGAGKTKVSCVIAEDLVRAALVERVIIIAPRRTVVDQWAREFAAVTGRHMMKITAADSVSVMSDDVCATWSAIKGLADVFQDICRNSRTLVICDEHHHAAIEAAWGTSADSAFKDAEYALILTGTPVRSDGAQSVWLDQNELGGLDHPEAGMYTLTYGEAVELGYCRPVTFHRHRGLFTVRIDHEEVIEVTGEAPPLLPVNHPAPSVLRRVVDFYRLARKPQFEADRRTPLRDGYHGTMVASACDKLDTLRYDMPEAAGLVIAPNIPVAKHFAELIRMIDGQEPMLVHSRLPNADRKIEAFRLNSSMKWLVAVGMVSEGVDIQRLRVLVYLPNATTELAFRQAVGRIVRNAGPHDGSRAYMVMPSFATFEGYARRVEDDMPASSIPLDDEPRSKRCRGCGAENDLGASTCNACGLAFPKQETRFRACPKCEGLNRVGQQECLHCGHDLVVAHEITLSEAARDGVIARGIDIPEEDVRKAEALLPHHIARLQQVEDEALARVLKSIPVELLPALTRLLSGDTTAAFADAGDA